MAARKSQADTPIISREVRLLLSVLIAFHLLAVVIGPLSFPARLGDPKQPGPGERPPVLAAEAADLLGPYLDLAHLRSGYRFFAPEPGFSSSRLVFELEFEDASASEILLPDPNAHWPRLRYHRHFMLAEQIRPADGWAESYCRHVQEQTGASVVRLIRIRRRVPFMDEVRRGATIPDESFDEREVLGEYTPD